MDGVRILRRVFWWAAWASLGFTGLTFVGIWLMYSFQPQAYSMLPPGSFMPQPVMMTLMTLPQQFAVPTLLFFAWGVLTGLEALHDLILELWDDQDQSSVEHEQ